MRSRGRKGIGSVLDARFGSVYLIEVTAGFGVDLVRHDLASSLGQTVEPALIRVQPAVNL